MVARLGSVLCVFGLLVALAGCGGGDGGGTTTPPSSNNPPPPPPLIGSNGGIVNDLAGASVTVPAGALDSEATIRIARDSTGAPPIPVGLTAAGNMYVVTPHGGNFALPIEVSIPAPAVTLLPTQQLKLAKAQPGGEWVLLDDTVLADGRLKTNVTSFSFFMAVVVLYPQPLAQFIPFEPTATLTCGNQDCARAVGPVDATFTLVGNNGQVPAYCVNPRLGYDAHDGRNFISSGESFPLTGFTISRTLPSVQLSYNFIPFVRCEGLSAVISDYRWQRRVSWLMPPPYPNLSIVRAPAQLDLVEGLSARLEVLVNGGAVQYYPNPGAAVTSTPTATDRASIDWQRSDDGGLSWRLIAQSFQNEANPQPFGTGLAWRPWSTQHGFIATYMDQSALIRARACYTPPAGTAAPPCVTSSATRLNVLQQSVLPSITAAPRSVLVRTGQTANLSVTVSGLPAPTLQWQTRPANSTGAWSDVTTGTGPTTTNYTTIATTLADNGVQYRALATNAVASTASAIATVSVSDLDVAPSITTQPANLSVASGGDAVFAIDARGTEALSYQWYRNGVALAGANSPVLRLTGVTMLDSGSFTVTVSNSAGNASSSSAILAVSASAPAAVAPSIVTQPAGLTANVGSTATLAVGVDGTGPFSFQWRRDGANMAGATSAVLTFPAVSLLNAGSFSVVVTNSAGSVTSSNAVLDVSAAATSTPPTITSQPSTLIVPFGGSGILAVGASGSGSLSYQWSRFGIELPGATLPVLDIPIVADVDVGTYTVTVSNSMGSVTSRAVEIILLGAPVIYQQPADVTALEGATATFYVTATSSGLRYQWSMNGNPIPGAIGNTLNVGPLVAANNGAVYSVLVYNGAGYVVSAPAVLRVTGPGPVTLLQQPENVSVRAGATANICMAFGGSPPFAVQMSRWQNSQWTPIGARQTFPDNGLHCIATPVLQSMDDGAEFLFLGANAEGGVVEAMTRIVTVTVSAP